MDNLRKGIKLFFSKWNSEDITHSSFVDFDQGNDLYSVKNFQSHAKGHQLFDNNSLSDIDAVHRKIVEDWMYCPYESSKLKSPFNLLTHFNKQVLTEKEAEPFVVHHHLLKWRDVTMDLGEDIFTTSYLAFKDIKARRERVDFSWRPTLFSDNYRLHQILQQGVAENHSHLWASSLTFDINWMALMNRYNLVKENFNEFLKKHSLNATISFAFGSKKTDYEVLIKKAIAIRFLLQLFIERSERSSNEIIKLKGNGDYIDNLLERNLGSIFSPSNKEDSIEFLSNFDLILKRIEMLGIEKGLKLKDGSGYKYFDYAALDSMHTDNYDKCFYLYGERHLMYQTFKSIYQLNEQNGKNNVLEALFHKYLLIKNQFRHELILLNKRIGFENFKEYQDRKFTFIPSHSIYSIIFLRISLNYNRRLMSVLSSEFRIGPESSVNRWKKSLNEILSQHLKKKEEKRSIEGYYSDELLDKINLKKNKNNKKEQTHFVIHFFKKSDRNFGKQNGINKGDFYAKQLITARDSIVRKEVKKGALTIVKLREEDSILAQKITGIDAASSELACRPEVFGQAFRYLKNHQARVKDTLFKENVYNNQLRITFHAGEDFYDVVDGMRYVDECVRFLNMGQGDRFGHALAIGIDVNQYYAKKQGKIMLTKQMLLDNVAWLLSKVRKFGLAHHLNEVSHLENRFAHLFSEVYLNSKVDDSLKTIDYSKYYDSWKLRGDSPEVYKIVMSEFEKEKKNKKQENTLDSYFNNVLSLTYWDRCQLNEYSPKLKSIRGRYEISRLYYEYHYNPNVKNKGNEITQFEITKTYIKLVEDIQIAMMEFVEERNLSIETNPTSNFLIGPIDRYIEHPILRWHNLGLHNNHELIENSPQLSVSINTDDAGVFSTSLENEFALMAIALEKEKDDYGKPIYSNSMIYDWIDRVRKMGIEQSFKR